MAVNSNEYSAVNDLKERPDEDLKFILRENDRKLRILN